MQRYIYSFLILILLALSSVVEGAQQETPFTTNPMEDIEEGAAVLETAIKEPVENLQIDDSLVSEDNVGDNIVVKEEEDKEQNLLDTAMDFYRASQELWSQNNLEESIKALDQAYALVLQVDTDNKPEFFQQKEDMRFMISKRILEIYASRYTAVNGNHKAIPLTMNKHVEHEIKQFQTVERNFFIEAYKRSGQYRDEIVKALNEAGLPDELSWLPLIESGFKVRALSRARALGLWQFIPSTGYKFGLKRDNWIDERMNPEKSTAAAIAYLQELHNMFGDWMTVLAGYNCGEGTVLRVIREQKINYLDHFWDLYERLPQETARYVPRFLATLHILKEPDKYGFFELEEPEKPAPYETVTIKKQVQLDAIARKLGISINELSDLNPELRREITPPALYSLGVPPEKGELLLAYIDEIPEWSSPPPPSKKSYVYHSVKKGETLSIIASKYGTSLEEIARANNIRKKNFIRVGQKLKIPLKKGLYERGYASKSELLSDGKYKIKKGDTLYLIAKRFNTDTKALQDINNLKSTTLYEGQIIRVIQ